MAVAEGARAYNPQTGQTAIFTGGRWVVQGAQQMPLPQADDDAMKSLHSQAQEAQYLDQKAQQFIKTMDPQRPGQGSFATGPIFSDVPIPHLVENINPSRAIVSVLGQDPRMSALDSITQQAWVHLRPQGSGAIRGYEAEAFKQAFPGVEHTGPANQMIAQRLHQDALIASHKLNFIDNFIRGGHGDYAAANAAWQQIYGDSLGQPSPQGAPQQPAVAPPQGGPPPGQPPPINPPMQMVPNAQSPIGAVPAPGVAPPPPDQRTPQQNAILNWVPGKGLVPP